MAGLFVSHATNDAVLVEEFVELLQVGIGIHPNDIFCSSLPGMGIPTGKDFVEHIKSKVQNPELVLLILSPAFFESEFCHNEVGASWVLSLPIYPILVPPLGYEAVRGVLAGKQASRIDDKEKLNDLRDDIAEKLKLTPLRTSHWERKRGKFLAKLATLISVDPVPMAGARTPPTGGTVTSSGSWLKLHDRFYEAHKVHRPGKLKVTLEILTTSAEEEAALDSLRPHHHGRGLVVGFAYQNDGGLVQIDNVASTSQGGRNLWLVELTMTEDQRGGFFSEMNLQGHSADEIAEMRAGRLLINDPPAPKKRRQRGMSDDLLEHAIVGSSDAAVKIDDCVIRAVVAQYGSDFERAMQLARLEAVFRLKATGIVESILEFSFGPMAERKLHVKFRGQRPRQASNVEPEMISIEGDCQLG